MTLTTNTSLLTLNEQVAEKIASIDTHGHCGWGDMDKEEFKIHILKILNEVYGQTNITIVEANE